MKLLIIYPADPLGSKVGGGETFLRGLIKYKPDNIQIEYVGITSDPIARPLNQWSNLSIHGTVFNFLPIMVEKDENKKTLIPLALRFVFALARIKLDLLGKVLFFNRIEPALLYQKHLAKFVVIHYDVERQIKSQCNEVFWSRIPWLYFELERYILPSMGKIFTVSQNMVSFYTKNYPKLKERVVFTPTWVDPEVFLPSKQSKCELKQKLDPSFNQNSTDKWILFVGRFQEVKAPIRIIDSFKNYLSSNSNTKLIMIGEGNLQCTIDSYIQLNGLHDKVRIVKGMQQTELLLFYQASDVLVLASNFEGMPMCVLEALGCGLPVVTTDVGEVRRVVKNNFSGEVVTSFDPIDIAKAFTKVLSAPNIYSVQNCLQSVEKYAPKIVLLPLYDSVSWLRATNLFIV